MRRRASVEPPQSPPSAQEAIGTVRSSSLRDFFVSPNKQFLNWRKVYRTMMILLMLHFLADQHRDRIGAYKSAYIIANEEPDLSHMKNINLVDSNEGKQHQLQEAATRLEEVEFIEKGYTFTDDGISPLTFMKNYIMDATYSIRAFITDVIYLHSLSIHVVSLEIIAIGSIIYVLVRPLDAPTQGFFYDSTYHKNIHQLPDRINRIAKRGLKWYRNLCMITAIWPMGTAISRETALMFVQGSMWMSLVKRGLKMLADAKHMKGARRPPNEHFIRGIYYGGFPSGHMSHSAYALTLTIISYSGSLHDQILLWGLGLHCFLAICWLVSSNRHYPSQIVAGMTLGTIYGFAAYKLIIGQAGTAAPPSV